jgi:hypothetical protein
LRHITLVGIVVAPVSARSSEEPSLKWVEPWAAVFADGTYTFHVVVSGNQAATYNANWRFSAGGRTLASREAEIDLGVERSVTSELQLDIPSVGEEVIFPADLTVDLHAKDGTEIVGPIVKRVWIFARAPFADRQQWLRGLEIHLYDPIGETAICFEKARIPFQRVYNLDASGDIDRGMFVVGEGISFDDCRGVPGTIIRLANRGVGVLCLAPTAGTVQLSSDDCPAIVLQRLFLDRQSIITRLDKRLDANAWPDRQPVVLHGVDVISKSMDSIAEVSDQRSSWPWLDVTYSAPHGRLIICGLGIVSGWQAGPTPSYLLLRIFQDLACSSRTLADNSEGEAIK